MARSVWLTDYKLDADRKGPANSSFVQTVSQITHFHFKFRHFHSRGHLKLFGLVFTLRYRSWHDKNKKILGQIRLQVEVGGKGNKIGSRQQFFLQLELLQDSVCNKHKDSTERSQPKASPAEEEMEECGLGGRISKFKENVLLRMNKLT